MTEKIRIMKDVKMGKMHQCATHSRELSTFYALEQKCNKKSKNKGQYT